ARPPLTTTPPSPPHHIHLEPFQLRPERPRPMKATRPPPATSSATTAPGLYTYHAEGNLLKKSKGATAETWNYSYDHENRLVSANQQQTDGGTLLMQATYTYDALANRSEKDVWTSTNGLSTSRYGYDGQNAWADLNG